MLAIVRRIRMGDGIQKLLTLIQIGLSETNSHWNDGVAIELDLRLRPVWRREITLSCTT